LGFLDFLGFLDPNLGLLKIDWPPCNLKFSDGGTNVNRVVGLGGVIIFIFSCL
jgi:hypothetical protein